MSRLNPAPAPASVVSGVVASTVLLLRPALLFVTFAICWWLIPAAGDRGANLLWQNVAIVGVDAVSIAVAARVLGRHGVRLRDLIRPRWSDLGWGPLVAVIATVGFLAAGYLANVLVYQGPPPASSSVASLPLWFGLWCLLVMPVTVALAEEIVYRGIGLDALTARWGRWLALFVSAACFGLQHLALTVPSPQAWAARFVTTFLAGLMFGLLTWWFRRLSPVIVGHWALDVLGLGVPAMMLALAS